MKNLNKQKGFSLMGMVIGILFLALVAVYGSQIGLGYMTQQTIKGATKSALIDLKNDDNATQKKVRDTIITKLSTNTIDLSSDDIAVEKINGGFSVTVNYIKEISVNEQITIVMDLSFTEETL